MFGDDQSFNAKDNKYTCLGGSYLKNTIRNETATFYFVKNKSKTEVTICRRSK